MWKKFLRDYFTFNKRERNGLLVLLFIMVLITVWPTVYTAYYKGDLEKVTVVQLSLDSLKPEDKKSMFDNNHSDTQLTALEAEYSSESNTADPTAIILFSFDPNTLDADGWRRLGIPEKNIRTIIKYKDKGGKFYKKEDLKKIYGFRETDYNRLEPYISFPQKPIFENAEKKETERKVETIRAPLELNTADSMALLAVNGIGPALTSRIIKYRNKLGGYVMVEQLREVYGLLPESFEQVKGQLQVDASKVKKLNINTVTANELKQHPYFRNPLAAMVISYRDQHGSFAQPQDLKNVELINDSVYQKILPYLEF
jgi:competence protein ComEA